MLLLQIETGLKCFNMHISKSIWVTSLLFCQNDSLMAESHWQKDSLVTHMLFDLCLFQHFSPVANFGYQSLYVNISKGATNDFFKWIFIFFTTVHIWLFWLFNTFWILQLYHTWERGFYSQVNNRWCHTNQNENDQSNWLVQLPFRKMGRSSCLISQWLQL